MWSRSLRNVTIDCNAENIHYVVSTPEGVFASKAMTTIKRLDPKTGEYVLIAELERNMFKSDRMRLYNPPTSDFLPINEVLKRTNKLFATYK